MHVDLIKLQAEYGANKSYRKAAIDLSRVVGERAINNHMRIRKITKKVGEILSNNNSNVKKPIKPCEELYAVADGGHVHDANNPGHNFEAMMGKIYKPSNVVRIDENHTKIIEKHCAGSGKYDKQKTMKVNFINAAVKEGIDKTKTTVIAFADGAKNCWNILESLAPFCLVLICILDWFHIGKYIQRIEKSMPNIITELDEIKEMLFHGNSEEALIKIQSLLEEQLCDKKHVKLIENFYQYISDNKKYLINYSERKAKGLIYTSHVAESTVEHLLNERCRRKQKMQWSRDGLHAVIQIRASQASNDWDNDWNTIIKPKLKAA